MSESLTEDTARLWPLAKGSEATVERALALTAGAIILWAHQRNALTAALAGLCSTLLLFLLYFLRDPERVPPDGGGLFVAPADGRVIAVESCEEPIFLAGPAVRIGIFMSIWNVHVNRAPMAGRVVYRLHQPGRFGPAFGHQAAAENERHLLGMVENETKVLVIQIAGAVARRIKCWPAVGQRLARGERFGSITLGSRVDVFLPPRVETLVTLCDKVRGGETVVARMPTTSPRSEEL